MCARVGWEAGGVRMPACVCEVGRVSGRRMCVGMNWYACIRTE